MKKPDTKRLYDLETFKKKAAEGLIVPLRKEIITTVSKAEGSTDEVPKLDFILSTSAVDRSKDTVVQEGWQLENFRKNPVVLFAHNSHGLPVGRAPSVGIEKADGGSRLVSRGTIFTSREVNQEGWAVGQMYLQGFLNAVSVGFLPHTYVQNAERGGWAVDFLTQELLEFSAVPIPANPEALIGAKSAGIPIEWVREWAQKILDTPVERDGFKPAWVEHVERMHAVVSPKTFQVPARKEDAPADDTEDDPLLEQMGNLEAALIANTTALEACTAACNAMCAAMTKAEPAKAQTSAVVKTPVTLTPRPAVTANSIADEVRKQLATLTGSL